MNKHLWWPEAVMGIAMFIGFLFGLYFLAFMLPGML